MRTPTRLLTAALTATVLALAGTAVGQADPPTPDVDDLGLSTNDVREEPSHHLDDNNFLGDHEGDFWSPKTDPLILDAFARPGFIGPWGEDVDNVVNRVQHGDNYGDHERTMYPGENFFGAWWGWWSDTGGGGDLETDDTTSEAPGVGEPNGAIDDADDCGDATWDEFTWRGDHPCPSETAHPSYPDDQIFAFVEPGTHFSNNRLVFEGPVDTLLASREDGAHRPDFNYEWNPSEQIWHVENSQSRITYDASLLVSTSVVSAVNPRELSSETGPTTYDPFTPASGSDHAVDVDVYTTPHPAVEQAYRTAVWDPDAGPHPDRGDNLDLVHENGPKGWAKDDGAALKAQAEDEADAQVDSALETVEPQRGLVNDLVQDPFFHEPNQHDDDYNGWAAHDPATSYGGLDGDYYEPGPDQAYPGYQAGERFWFDAQVAINSFPLWAPGAVAYGGSQFTPRAPSPSDPVGSAAGEDSTTQGPGILYMHAHAGTWYDGGPEGDQDTWVGNAPPDPYGNGTLQDPNMYQAEETPLFPSGDSGPEWRGTCGVDVEATLYPTSDTDGDGTPDWGAAGVYVMGSIDTNPYSDVAMDVVGPAADPVLEPLRDHPQAGETASYLVPRDGERLSGYRTQGPIDVRGWECPAAGFNVGYHPALYNILLPTGTLDFTFEAVSHAELTDPGRVSQHGDNEGQSLAGATITDVDRYGRIQEAGP